MISINTATDLVISAIDIYLAFVISSNQKRIHVYLCSSFDPFHTIDDLAYHYLPLSCSQSCMFSTDITFAFDLYKLNQLYAIFVISWTET